MAFGYSFFLYFREKKTNDLGKWIKYIVFSLRFILVFILAFLLLSPLVKSISRTVEKPIIVIAQDNSKSILLNKDSAFYKGEFAQKVKSLVVDLSDKFEVQEYSFGNKITQQLSFSYDEKQTDFIQFVQELQNNLANRNVGAVIFASDGIYNRGSNPVYEAEKLNAPFYSISMGDTAIQKDLILKKVEHNRIAFLGNEFPMQVTVLTNKLKGENAELNIFHKGKSVFNKKISIGDDVFTLEVPVQIETKEVGLQRYTIALSEINGEVNLVNNKSDVLIDVLDSREKILILTEAPHPDIAALKNAIESNNNYQAEVSLVNDFNQPLKQYSLVVFYQLPTANNISQKILTDAKQLNVPSLFILGANSNVGLFNTLDAGVKIVSANGKMNECEAIVNKDFNLFTVSDKFNEELKDFPALSCPFGNYQLNNSAQVMMYQKIGMVTTQNPILFFTQNGNSKIGVLCGEGIWRWHLRSFAQTKSHELFNEFVNKIVQYLSIRVDRNNFIVNHKKFFSENEDAEFDAEVYNQSYELINEGDVSIELMDAEGKKYPYTFSKTANAYHLNVGNIPVGEYSYQAKAKVGVKPLTAKGSFSVAPVIAENLNTIADHHLLYMLSQSTGGKMFYPNQLDLLKDELMKREDLKSVSYSNKKLIDLINLPWVFFLLLLLVSAEWVIRKYNGVV